MNKINLGLTEVLLFSFLILIMFGCKTGQPPLVERKTSVRFKAASKEDFVSPSFRNLGDSSRSISFIVRTAIQPKSEIQSENLAEYERSVLELESSLVRNYFRVIDRGLYVDQKKSDSLNDKSYPFDYIVEISDLLETRHYTGIRIHHQEHFLTGKIMTIKIIDPKSMEIVALFTEEYVPCVKGCTITYNWNEILEVTERKDERGATSDEEQESNTFEAISEQIVKKIRKVIYK